MGLMLHTLALVATAAAALPAVSRGEVRWGSLAHRVVARVASLHIDGSTEREVRRLLGRESLAEVSTWADDIRAARPATSTWHYVNIPTWQSAYRTSMCPRAGCVIGTLETQEKILADRSRSRTERAEALKWVVHMVADLHMPLHVGDRGDRGGNDVKLSFLGRQTNLHALWDSGLLNAIGHNEGEFVATIRDQIRNRGDLHVIAGGSVLDWAMESHAVARDVAYPFLTVSLVLDERYLEIARPVLHDRILRASVRLAAVLDRTLGKGGR